MFNTEKCRKVCNEIYELMSSIDNSDGYEKDTLEACEKLYEYMDNSAAKKSLQNNTEGVAELEEMLEKGLDKKELEYISIYHKDAYDAYNLVYGTELFNNYFYYQQIKENLDMISENFFNI